MIAEPGQIGIADTSHVRDGFQVCRVVKPNHLGGMWAVEVWERSWRAEQYDWRKPCRRKVSQFIPIGDADPNTVYEAIRARQLKLWDEQQQLRDNYQADIANIAKGVF